MSLIPLIHFIGSIRSTTVQNNRDTPLSQSTINYLHFLRHIQQLLQSSEAENNIQKLHEAIKLLETVPMKGLFENHKLGHFIADENHPTLIPAVKLDFYQKSCQALPNRYQKLLIHIHHKLMKHAVFQAKNKPSWSFNYEFNQEKNARWNKIIETWQRSLMKLAALPKAAYADYLRDLLVQGMADINLTKSQIEMIIKNLVANSNYSEQDKPLIIKWLEANGGQNNNRFVDFLLQGGLLEINRLGLATAPTGYVSFDELFFPKFDCFGLLKAKSLEQGWFNNNGEICFICDIAVYSLMHEKKSFIFIDPTIESNQVGDQLRMTNNVDYYPENNSKALIRFQAQLTLRVIETPEEENIRSVIPEMTALKVTGFTRSLSSKYDLAENNQLTPQQALPNVMHKH